MSVLASLIPVIAKVPYLLPKRLCLMLCSNKTMLNMKMAVRKSFDTKNRKNLAFNYISFKFLQVYIKWLYNSKNIERHHKYICDNLIEVKLSHNFKESLKSKRPTLILMTHSGFHYLGAVPFSEVLEEINRDITCFMASDKLVKDNSFHIDLLSKYKNINVALNNRKDLIHSFKKLKSGGCLSLYVDVFNVSGSFSVTKVFNEIYPSMLGAAYFISKLEDVDIIMPTSYWDNGKIIFESGELININKPFSGNIRAINDEIFRNFESVIASNPYSWEFISELHKHIHGKYEIDFKNESLLELLSKIEKSNLHWQKSVNKITDIITNADVWKVD
ncbi:hypothetical protein [Pseudoalteromonas sp. MMG007]|uniref:hypothetical protein n=1 Tax=Pseudoalteromonas sp. MMG007 TaxID=2822684 RepID=UPI001B36F552|nr:hypothetical protein [Pseudoalteromonas sp. MMG007]MBQ4859995.1 hypothetical protein [Pseudoalteromonas sp. MMG007]